MRVTGLIVVALFVAAPASSVLTQASPQSSPRRANLRGRLDQAEYGRYRSRL